MTTHRHRRRYTVTLTRFGDEIEVQIDGVAAPEIAAERALRLHPRATLVRVEPGWARPGGKARSERVEIVLEPAERKRYQLAADSEGISLSEWIRRAAEERLPPLARE